MLAASGKCAELPPMLGCDLQADRDQPAEDEAMAIGTEVDPSKRPRVSQGRARPGRLFAAA